VNVATSAVTAFQIYDAVRLIELRAWIVNDVTVGTAGYSNVALSFPTVIAGGTGDQREINITSISTTEPAFGRIRADPKSAQSLFQSNAGGIAFRVDVAGQSPRIIIEADLEFVFNSDAAPIAVTNAPAAAAIGQFYFRGMDGLALAATLWPTALNPSN